MAERRGAGTQSRWPERRLPPWGLPHPLGHPPGPLVTTVLFCMLLDPVLLLTQGRHDPPAVEGVPGLQMKFDPRTMELSWDCAENTTSLECVMIHEEKGEIRRQLKNKECHCKFLDYSLHGGVTFMVKVNTTQGLITEKLVYTNPGGEGTAAQNFSCFIYNVSFMNCTWARGPAAPEDVQYFLYIRNSKKKVVQECPQYIEASGTHVGCYVKDLSWLSFYNYFLVNGTSRHTGIQFFDSILSTKKIGAGRCGAAGRRGCDPGVPWNKEHTGNQLIDVSGDLENKYNFPCPEPRAKHTVKIRTSDARAERWGPWSQPLEFGSTKPAASFVHVYVLVVLGTLVCALILSCVLKRFFASETLFPRIPRVKDKWTDDHHTDHQIIWEKCTSDTEQIDHEEIVTVQEVSVTRAST
ncbi:granulocyte-macrophage colony-stimulating factor receptor subunit alpha [Crocuta crocuta]